MTRTLSALALLGTACAWSTAAGAADDVPAPATMLVGAVLNVIDPEREIAFYRDAFGLSLGMTLDHGNSREYMLRFGGPGAPPTLILQHDRAAAPVRALEAGTAFNRLVLRVTDMDRLLARLDVLKVAHAPPRATSQGYRMLQLTDPEGHALEVIQSAPRPGEQRQPTR